MQSGFTLVELVTVIAVTSVIAAVAAPRFIGTDTFSTRGDLGVLITSLRYAQKTAITQHRTVYVQWNATSNTLSLCYTSSCDSLLQDPATSASYQVVLNKNALVTPPSVTVGFTSDGLPTPNADATYTIVNKKNSAQTSTIKIEANTGYVHKL